MEGHLTCEGLGLLFDWGYFCLGQYEVGNQAFYAADICAFAKTYLDMPRARPKLYFRIQVEVSSVFGRPHVNGFPRKGIDLYFFSGEALAVAYDQSFVREGRDIAYRFEGRIALLAWREHLHDVLSRLTFLKKSPVGGCFHGGLLAYCRTWTLQAEE